MLNQIDKTLTAFGVNVVSAAKNNLTKNNNAGELANSLTYEITKQSEKIELTFYGTSYGNFHDKVVQGAAPNKLPRGSKWYGVNKAPGSPFKFGSGTGRKGGLRGAIDRWVVSKPISDARNAKGQFIKRKSLVYLISRTIYLSGTKATDFFSKPFDLFKKNLFKDLNNAFAQDVREITFKNNDI